MRTILYFSFLFFLGCSQFSPSFVKEDNVYLYQGKDQVIVSFTSDINNNTTLKSTAQAVSFLLSHLPDQLKNENFYIEGLTGEIFTDFFTIADNMFLSVSYFQNKALVYGYISSLYEQFMLHYKQYPFIPIKDFEMIMKKNNISVKKTDLLFKFTVKYALDNIFFISILEFFERPNRYFFPTYTNSELFKILVFPEMLTFWKYMEFRFGKQVLLEYAQKQYTPEEFYITFGEKISEIENTYVKGIEALDENTKDLSLIKDQLIQTLKLYMSGTKKSLMSK